HLGAANRAGITASEPEGLCGEVDDAARQVISDAGYGQYFIHRTGHGLGLEVHEPPNMLGGVEQPMLPGMVFTVEPGVYIPDVGGVRIEDDVVITPNGPQVMTSFPKTLQTVGL
ncbi:MAG: M24 family metallopeptidase, partial [Chloroflexota bacterium]